MVSIHPGVTREQIQDNTGWQVRYAEQGRGNRAADRAGARRAARIACPHRARAWRSGGEGIRDARRFHLRCRPHADRPLWRLARQGAHRRSRRGPDQGAGQAQCQGRLDRARRGLFRLRQPGRRGQPQRRAHGAVARGAAGQRSRHHAQPALRLRSRCGRHRRARDPLRRDRFRHRRRRGIDDARAVRDGQGAGGVLSAAPRSSTPPSAGASSIR